MNFKERLKELRKSRKLSQAALAEKLNVSFSLIGMYESGRRMPSYEMLETLADYFNVDVNYLTGRDNSTTRIPGVVDDEDMKVALFGTTDVPDSMLEDVRKYARFLMQR